MRFGRFTIKTVRSTRLMLILSNFSLFLSNQTEGHKSHPTRSQNLHHTRPTVSFWMSPSLSHVASSSQNGRFSFSLRLLSQTHFEPTSSSLSMSAKAYRFDFRRIQSEPNQGAAALSQGPWIVHYIFGRGHWFHWFCGFGWWQGLGRGSAWKNCSSHKWIVWASPEDSPYGNLLFTYLFVCFFV